MSEGNRFETMQRYLRFSDRDRELLATLEPHFRPRLPAMVADFYARIESDSQAASIMAEPERIDRLKRSLRTWTERLFVGPYDDAYFEMRARIGRRHVEIGLPERFMPLAMGVIREHVVEVALAVGGRDLRYTSELVAAVSKILDLELTIMLDSYHADTLDRIASSERAHVIQAIANGLSRELKNLLGVIQTSLFLLRKTLPADAEQRELVDRISRTTRRIGDVSDHILEFARPKRRGSQRVRAAELVEEAIALAGDPSGCSIEPSIDPPDLELTCTAADFARGLANVIKNAIQAMAHASRIGRLSIRVTRDRSLGVVFEISDHGPGVDPDLRERIFEPLFSTREGGLGLGLSYARDVAIAHGGRLELAAAEGGGATFRWWVPATLIKPAGATDRAEARP